MRVDIDGNVVDSGKIDEIEVDDCIFLNEDGFIEDETGDVVYEIENTRHAKDIITALELAIKHNLFGDRALTVKQANEILNTREKISGNS